MPFSADEFRAALGAFATGVTVVTARDAAGRPVGLTANSFNSVSIEPSLVLWSLSRRAGSMAVFAAGAHYAINVLAADQRPLAERFAERVDDRFEGVAHRLGDDHGLPILDGAAAVFECLNKSRYDEGDHCIFVGQVVRCWHRPEATPLVFHAGRYFTSLS